jgi:hypothetical protein
MSDEKIDIEVGPIWNNDHAQTVGNDWIAKNPGYVWRGGWRTTKEGVMSVLEVYRSAPPAPATNAQDDTQVSL